jgi:hypothetical protein
MPLFWNIYFEPLLRKLRTFSDGVTLTAPAKEQGAPDCSVTITCQVFADDLLAPCDSPSAVQTRTDDVMDWGKDWSMRINTKVGKTQAVHVPGAPGPPASTAALPAPLNGGPGPDGKLMHVTWAKGYRYLGLPMTADLDWGPYVDKRVSNLNYGYARYFRYNSVIHRMPLCAQVQLLQTLVISGVNYLIGALPTTAAQSRRMDAAARRSVRRIFCVPSKAPRELVDAEVSFLPFSSTILMHQVRLYLSIKHNPFQQTPAAQILTFIYI